MKPDTPILTITLQIPLLPDTRIEDILDVIGQQLGEAMEAAREQTASDDGDDREEAEGQPESSISTEIMEPFSEGTKQDLLSALGYTALD